MAMEEGGWTAETLDKAPVTVSWQNSTCSLIDHVRAVTRLCIKACDELAPFYSANGVRFDRDTVVCGALLHDIGKWTEFCLVEGEAVHGPTADLLRHPLSGALIADRAGLPTEIVHLISTHSFEGDRSYQTAESAFVRALDIFVFNCSVFGLKKTVSA